jgi:hypothetical protein
MDVIPLKFIHHDDVSIVGKELVDLASLQRLGFPVPEGLVLLPPQLPLTTVLKAYKEHDRDRFEQSLEIIRRQVYAIAPPEALIEHLKPNKIFAETVWKDALKSWLEQIRSRVWRLGVSIDLVEDLTAIPVFFTGNHHVSGRAYFNSETQKIVIQVINGELEDDLQKKIEETVEKSRKKVLTSYIFDWIFDGKDFWIVRVYPFTHEVETEDVKEKVEIQTIHVPVVTTKRIQTSLKIYGDLSDGLTIAKEIDGVFIASEKVENDDQRILKLVESALAVDDDVIFQLADVRSLHDVGSGLRLLHQVDFLEREIQTFLFAKHHYTKVQSVTMQKRILQNLHISIPIVRNVSEFSKIKIQLMNLGLNNVNTWVDFSIPENWIHLEEYLKIGLDGVIVNMDELYGFLIGVEQYNNHPFYNFETKTVIEFIAPYLKLLHKEKVKVFLRSEHVLDPEIIKFSIAQGIYGLILKPYHLAGSLEYIGGFERKHILNKQPEL